MRAVCKPGESTQGHCWGEGAVCGVCGCSWWQEIANGPTAKWGSNRCVQVGCSGCVCGGGGGGACTRCAGTADGARRPLAAVHAHSSTTPAAAAAAAAA